MDPSSEVDPQDARRSLQRAERLLACFQKALGHELPNQLVAIEGLVYLFQEEEGKRLGPEGRDCLRRLGAVAKRTHILVRELAEVGRALRQRPAGGEALLRDTAQEAIAAVKQLSPGQPIEYHITDPGSPLPVPEAGLRQVLVALLQLAVRRAAGRPLRVEVGARGADGGAEVWLADDAPSPPPAERQHLFEPFTAADGDPGLGLFLGALLVDSWGGALDVESTPERGNRFTITLPRRA